MFLCLLATEPSWQWPIDVSKGVTASFGEYRGLRLHMGLDFSTGGVEGLPVKPAQEGRVYRVRSQDNGYGRAVYMEHAGKKVTVYAHLAAFGPKLAAAIKAAGYNPESSFGTLELKLPLTSADLLAYTGESGAGLPHFHFEVRQGEEIAVDPLTLAFPPLQGTGGKAVVEGFYLEPLTEQSLINNNAVPFFAKPNGAAVRASGKIGLRIPAYIAGVRGSRLGCRGLTITSGGKLLASWSPTSIPFSEYRAGGLVHDQAYSGFSPTVFAYCFDDRADLLAPLSGYKRNHVLDVTARQDLEIAIMNLAGIWTTFKLALDPEAPLQKARRLPAAPVQVTTLNIIAQGDRLYFKGEEEGTLQLPETMMGMAPGETQMYRPASGTTAEKVVWKTSGGALSRMVGALPAGTEFQYKLGPWVLDAEGLSKLPAIAVFLEPADQKIMANEITYHSPVLHFGRPGMPTKGLRASFSAPDPATHLGIYAWSFTSRKWRHWGALKDGNSVELDYLTPLVIGEDTSKPTISRPRVHKFFTGARTVIPLSDKGSGIDSATIAVYQGDKKLNITYDGDRSWIILPKNVGREPFSVDVSDRAGLANHQDGLSLYK